MSKFIRSVLAFLGLVKKYEPVAEQVVKDVKPLVKDLLDKGKK